MVNEESWRASYSGIAFHRKSLQAFQDEAERDASEAGPKWNLFDLLCIGIGSTIGSGIFVLTGQVAPIAGPSAIVSWILAGLVCLFSTFSYIELCMRIPTSGSCYTYSHHCLGELVGMIGAICLTMEYGISGAGVARNWSQLVASLVDGSDYMYFWYPGAASGSPSVDWYFDPAAGLIVLASVAICSSGVSIGKLIINSFTLMKIALVVFLIVAGLSLWTVNIFESTASFLPSTGWGGTMRGVSALFFGFIGFDEVCCLSGKAVQPTHTMPRALAGTLLGAAGLSTLAQLALAGMVPASSDALQWPDAFDARGCHWAALLVNIGMVILLPLVVLLSILPQPELMGIMAQDGLIPAAFARKNADGTYVWASNVSGLVMVIVAATVPFYVLWDMISLGVLLGFNLTNTSLIMVRYGNGGEVRTPGLSLWVACFWASGAAGAYTMWKGVIGPALTGDPCSVLALFMGAICLVLAILALVKISITYEEFQTRDSAEVFRTPAVPFVPGLAILLNFMLMATIAWWDHFLMLCCFVPCLGVYALKSRSRVAAYTGESDSGSGAVLQTQA